MLYVLGTLVALCLLLFVLPAWSLADCLAREHDKKGPWVAAIIILWPIGSVIYGGFGTRRSALRVLAAVVAIGNAYLMWIGQVNASIESPGLEPTPAHYDSIAATDRLELTGVFGSYGSRGNDDPVQALALSEDGTRLAVSGGRTLRLWDVGQGKLVETHEALPANDILAGWLHGRWLGRGDTVALSPDGKTVAAARGSVSIRLGFSLLGLFRDAFDGRGRGVVCVFDGDDAFGLRAHRSNVSGLAVQDGRLVTASYDGTITVWELASRERVREIEAHSGWIRQFAVSQDGRLALTSWHEPYPASGPSGGLTLWDLPTGGRVDLTDSGDEVAAVGFTDDGRYALGASFDRIRVWSPSGTLEKTVHGAFTQVVFSLSGRYALSGDDVVDVWDLDREKIIDRIPVRSTDDEASAAVFGPDDELVLIGTKRGAILRYRFESP